jgi:hypothetical protein
MKTKEETITWQNQSHLIQRYLECNKIPATLQEMCRITDVMSEYAIQGRTEQVMKKLEAVDKYLVEKYTKQLLNE